MKMMTMMWWWERWTSFLFDPETTDVDLIVWYHIAHWDRHILTMSISCRISLPVVVLLLRVLWWLFPTSYMNIAVLQSNNQIIYIHNVKYICQIWNSMLFDFWHKKCTNLHHNCLHVTHLGIRVINEWNSIRWPCYIIFCNEIDLYPESVWVHNINVSVLLPPIRYVSWNF